MGPHNDRLESLDLSLTACCFVCFPQDLNLNMFETLPHASMWIELQGPAAWATAQGNLFPRSGTGNAANGFRAFPNANPWNMVPGSYILTVRSYTQTSVTRRNVDSLTPVSSAIWRFTVVDQHIPDTCTPNAPDRVGQGYWKHCECCQVLFCTSCTVAVPTFPLIACADCVALSAAAVLADTTGTIARWKCHQIFLRSEWRRDTGRLELNLWSDSPASLPLSATDDLFDSCDLTDPAAPVCLLRAV